MFEEQQFNAVIKTIKRPLQELFSRYENELTIISPQKLRAIVERRRAKRLVKKISKLQTALDEARWENQVYRTLLEKTKSKNASPKAQIRNHKTLK